LFKKIFNLDSGTSKESSSHEKLDLKIQADLIFLANAKKGVVRVYSLNDRLKFQRTSEVPLENLVDHLNTKTFPLHKLNF